MKILTICSAGAVRSVSMAYILKHKYYLDAIPVGADANSPETIAMLSDWAELILIMQPMYGCVVPERNAAKIVVTDVGPDIWMNSLHPDLLRKVLSHTSDLESKGLIKKKDIGNGGIYIRQSL